jgi:hypothetical protein
MVLTLKATIRDQSEQIAKLEAENAAIRTLMNSYNLGGWTDSLGLITEQRRVMQMALDAIEDKGLLIELQDALRNALGE